MLKKVLLGLAAILVIATLAFFYYINTSQVELPADTDAIVKTAMASEIPKLVVGETGMATNGKVKIWYESKMPSDSVKGTVLLVMGLGASAMIWDNEFHQPFLDAGYQVIRFDNRDVGLSTWLEDWDEDNPYSLKDMAKDGIAVLDELKISKAHVIGASMGGMIVQQMAISHPDRIASLTSIMSSGYITDPDVPTGSDALTSEFTKLGLKLLVDRSDRNFIHYQIMSRHLLKGDGPYDINIKNTALMTLYELKERNGYNPNAAPHQIKAMEVSGSRLEALSQITVPTLILHGKSDPLVQFEHALKYAPLIPNADTLFIEGMGHDLPMIYREQIHAGILNTMAKFDESLAER